MKLQAFQLKKDGVKLPCYPHIFSFYGRRGIFADHGPDCCCKPHFWEPPSPLPAESQTTPGVFFRVAHLGYAFVPLCIGGFTAWSASLIYLVTYIITALAAFSLIILEEGETETAGDLEHYRGLGHRKPIRAAGIALAFFSLAGIPMTAGFIGKWSIFQSALAGEQYLLVGAVIAGAALGVFYYLRVIASLYFSEKEKVPATIAMSPILRFVIFVLLITVLFIGIYPEPLLTHVSQVAPGSDQYDFALRGKSGPSSMNP